MVRIALTPCRHPDDYERSLLATGAEPWRLDIRTADPEQIVATADAVLLTGGDDIDPAYFGEAPHPTFRASEPGRDAFEVALTRAALRAELPVLAICRGLQVLNVACGGSLVQDIPSEPGTHLAHSVFPPATRLAHAIVVEAGTRLARALGARDGGAVELQVNSRHHQAVRRVGTGLLVSAAAADGVIEGIEHAAHPFCLGVQWHPENFHGTGAFNGLFAGLVAAAATR